MNTAGWADLVRCAAHPGSAGRTGDLRRAVLLGLDVAPGVTVGCSITELDGTTYRTSVFTNQLALELDLAQYESGTGPCVSATRDHRMHQLDDLDSIDHFTIFTAVALEHGVRSSLSLPLAGAQRPSALNLYASARRAFAGDHARAVAQLLARAIAARGRTAGPASSVDPADEQRVARAHTQAALIRNAQQALAATHGSPEQAFGWLTRQSKAQRRSIFAVAQDAVHGEVTS